MALTAIIGSGGKTSLLADLARQYLSAGQQVITTTTTKLSLPQPGHPLATDLVVMAEDDAADEVAVRLTEMLPLASGRAVLLGQTVVAGKIIGLDPEFMDQLHAGLSGLFPDLHILVEADGSAHLPLKAHAPWEPVIPVTSDKVILCAGLDGLGRTWGDAVHRWQFGQRELGLPPYQGRRVSEDDFVALLALAVSKSVPSTPLEILLNKTELLDPLVCENLLRLAVKRLALPIRFGSLYTAKYQDLPHA